MKKIWNHVVSVGKGRVSNHSIKIKRKLKKWIRVGEGVIELFPANIAEIGLHLIVTNSDNTKCSCKLAPHCCTEITGSQGRVTALFNRPGVFEYCFYTAPNNHQANGSHNLGGTLRASSAHRWRLTTIYHSWLHISQFMLEHIWPGFDCTFKDRFWLGLSSWAEISWPLAMQNRLLLLISANRLQQLIHHVNESRAVFLGEISPLSL